MNRRVAVRGIAVHQGKLLCVRLKPYEGSIQLDEPYWCLPGGGLEPGEPLLEGIEREMFEETGVKPKVGALLYVQQYEYKGREDMEFFFHITNPEDYLNVDLSKTSHGDTEIAEIAFVDPQTTHILPQFLTQENIADDIERGTTRVFNYL